MRRDTYDHNMQMFGGAILALVALCAWPIRSGLAVAAEPTTAKSEDEDTDAEMSGMSGTKGGNFDKLTNDLMRAIASGDKRLVDRLVEEVVKKTPPRIGWYGHERRLKALSDRLRKRYEGQADVLGALEANGAMTLKGAKALAAAAKPDAKRLLGDTDVLAYLAESYSSAGPEVKEIVRTVFDVQYKALSGPDDFKSRLVAWGTLANILIEFGPDAPLPPSLWPMLESLEFREYGVVGRYASEEVAKKLQAIRDSEVGKNAWMGERIRKCIEQVKVVQEHPALKGAPLPFFRNLLNQVQNVPARERDAWVKKNVAAAKRTVDARIAAYEKAQGS